MKHFSYKHKFAPTLLFSLIVLFQSGWAKNQFPQPRGYVNDFANVIPPSYDRKITALAGEVERKTGVQIAVVTMEDIDDDYQDYANKLFEAWGIGHKGKDNGILIFNVVKQRKIQIEVGYGLEGFINDAKAGDIYRQAIRPHLKEGNYGPGFLAGVQAIAGLVGKEYGVTFTGKVIVPRRTSRTRQASKGSPLCLIIGFIILMSLMRRGGVLPWIFLGSMLGSGHRSSGGFGGGFGGGGFSGGFGGFGGGFSGGGGAGGGY